MVNMMDTKKLLTQSTMDFYKESKLIAEIEERLIK